MDSSSSQTYPKLSNSNSPPRQDSGLLSFLDTLSPIKPLVESHRYSNTYSFDNLPNPSPVFASPRMDSQRPPAFFNSAQNVVKKEENNEVVCSGKKSCESPASIEKYLAFESSSDGKEGEITPNSVSKKKVHDQRLNQMMKYMSGAFDDPDVSRNSSKKSQLDEQLVIEDGFNHQQKICRNLQFQDSNLGLVSNLKSPGSLILPGTESCVSSVLQRAVSLSIDSKEMHKRKTPSLSNNSYNVSVEKSYFHEEDDHKENLAIMVAGSDTSLSADHRRDNSSCVYGFKPLVASSENGQNSNIDIDLYQFSSKKNRKKISFSGDNEGCKRCNCKRSRCLKLYCDCFASGVYCVDTCACENCFNKPEYEDTVLDMRQKIENRNPLAFAPKVVKHPTKSPASTMETTPSSARHKRGCNCKRSKCLKKYCECYQAGVGCSDGCRCEECGNSFGKKTELIYRARTNALVPPTYMLPSPIPHPITGIISSSASQLHPNQGSNVHNLTGYLGFNDSPANHSQKLHEQGMAELSSVTPDRFLFHTRKENVSPDIMNSILAPLSPKQKQQLTPSGSRNRRKFVLQNVSPFPPLTPFSSSKGGGMPRNESSSK